MKMKIAKLFIAALLFATISTQAPARTEFVPGFDDLPLMPGMVLIPDTLVSFDAPSGRMVFAKALSELSEVQISAFYKATLETLGWKENASRDFNRDKETLKIEYKPGKSKSAIFIYFSLAPKA
ncbi:MAG: hypothetical protein ACTSXQ_00570 [Alphaproteobacteria bacterium]